jgi:hypothetical protein
LEEGDREKVLPPDPDALLLMPPTFLLAAVSKKGSSAELIR